MILFYLICLLVISKAVEGEIEAHEYCIIGAGPAGLQLAYFLSKSNRNYIVFEKNNQSGNE